jgi:hypothetical protein
MNNEAKVNLEPSEINGVRDSKLAFMASHVDPQIKQSKI